MPPWLDTPDEAGAVIVAALGVLATIGVGIVGAAAAVYAAWRSKLKPLLTQTQKAATVAADQLTTNHGSSTRDAVNRIEATVDRLDRTVTSRFGEVRHDMHLDREQAHRRIERLERFHSASSPIQENTQP